MLVSLVIFTASMKVHQVYHVPEHNQRTFMVCSVTLKISTGVV